MDNSTKVLQIYILELAISAKSELDAISKLSKIFGNEIKSEIKYNSISKRGDLFIVSQCFSKAILTDKVLRKLRDNIDIIVLSNNLSIKRSTEILQYCLPVEVKLKKLLTYVYPDIIEIFDGKTSKKSRIELCKQISSLTLGKLIECLEVDLSTRKRSKLLEDGEYLTNILNTSNSLDDLKSKILPIIKPVTVWEQINSILEKPVAYNEIKEKLHILWHLRNIAAHPQIILKSDVDRAIEASNFINERITNVKDDYKESLTKSIKSLGEVLGEMAKQYTSETQKVLEVLLQNMPTLNKNLNAFSRNLNTMTMPSVIDQVDWSSIDSEMRNSDPELNDILTRFDDNNAQSVIDNFSKEIANLKHE